jgi:predicted kinase
MKSIITELNEIVNYIDSLKKTITEEVLSEGVEDPGILKCVFMAGGPGSGKSYVSSNLFGIDSRFKNTFSSFGLKVVNSDSAFENALSKNGINPKDLSKLREKDPEYYEKVIIGGIREKAKSLTAKQRSFFEEGRLGMIVDGTGDDYAKIAKQKAKAESLGYDCYMVFVNTSLESALKNNNERSRTLPMEFVQSSWKECQNNLGKFYSLFGGRFAEIDNTNRGEIAPAVQKAVRRFLNEPIQNPIGKEWVTTAKMAKSTNK